MIRGILGGSFDPVHGGHVAMARHVLERGLVQRVHVIPARLSPHKDSCGAPEAHRLAMVRLAFAPAGDEAMVDVFQDHVIIDELELSRPGPSFTVDTLEQLKQRYPGDELVLIMGDDSLASLPRWKDLPRLARLARVLVLARDFTGGAPSVLPEGLDPRLNITRVSDFDHPVSSTGIRAILDGGGEARAGLQGLLPPSVLAYIDRHQLYRK